MYNGNWKKKDFGFIKQQIISSIPNEPLGISSKDIARNINLDSRDVRCMIQILRSEGYAICSSPKDGYWYARSSDELNITISKIETQIDTMQETKNALFDTYKWMKAKETGE